MNLEESIQQTKPFRTNKEKVLVNLIYTYNWVSAEMKDYFAQFGITPKQYNILRILNGVDEPVSIAFIRERLLHKLSDVSRIVDRLHNRELIQKDTCHQDRRLIDVQLSPKGKNLLNTTDESEDSIASIMHRLTAEEAATLSSLLDKIRN